MSQQEVEQEKVKQVAGGAAGGDNREMMALMVEVADALADDTRRPSLAVAVPGGKGRAGQGKGRM